MSRNLFALVLFLVLLSSGLLGACGSSDSSTPVSTNPVTGNTGILKNVGTGVDSCVALNTEIRAMAQAQLQTAFSTYKTPNAVSYSSGVPTMAPVSGISTNGSSASASVTQAAASATDNSNFSGTTIQSVGVDELDTVKNDGEFLWTFKSSGTHLVLTQTSLNAANTLDPVAQISWVQNQSTATDSNWLSADGMFRLSDGKIAAVVSGGAGYFSYWTDAVPVGATSSAALPTSRTVTATGASATSLVYPGPGYSTIAPYTELRIMQTQGSSFEVQQTYRVRGRLLAARRLQASDAMLLVTEAPVVWPKGLLWYPIVAENATQEALVQAWPTLLSNTLEANLRLINSASLEQWLGQDSPPSAAECQGYVRADAANRLALTRLATINPNSKTKTETVLLTEGSGVYVNAQSLYLSTRRWDAFDGTGWQAGYTDIHRFSLTSGGAIGYQASGKFAGWLLNRYAMDEIDQGGRAVLRIAASDRKLVASTGSVTSQPYSYLATFEQQGNTIATLASSDAIAVGETLQSARFVGDKAYVVTFRVVDPFFVFDLSDPKSIVKKGELKVPGYSTYLHPISSTLIFGVGVDSGAWPRKIKASLYDVSNPLMPVELGSQTVGDSNSFSEALWEPHALTFYRPTGSAGSVGETTWIGLPVGNELKLLNVSASEGLTSRGALALSRDCCASRSVFVSDQVYAIGQGQLATAKYSQPQVVLGSATLLP